MNVKKVLNKLGFTAAIAATLACAPVFAGAPSCCVGGNCCASGKCCTMDGCCKADKSCCNPAKGVCASTCGCLGMSCCGDGTKAATAAKATKVALSHTCRATAGKTLADSAKAVK